MPFEILETSLQVIREFQICFLVGRRNCYSINLLLRVAVDAGCVSASGLPKKGHFASRARLI